MKDYIPKTKDDVDSINILKSCSFEEIKKDTPKLLAWMQDLHWDVAHGIASYFIPHINKIKEELISILNSDDDEWKFSILVSLISKSPSQLDHSLILILQRISENPTQGEIREELDVISKQILNKNN